MIKPLKPKKPVPPKLRVPVANPVKYYGVVNSYRVQPPILELREIDSDLGEDESFCDVISWHNLDKLLHKHKLHPDYIMLISDIVDSYSDLAILQIRYEEPMPLEKLTQQEQEAQQEYATAVKIYETQLQEYTAAMANYQVAMAQYELWYARQIMRFAQDNIDRLNRENH